MTFSRNAACAGLALLPLGLPAATPAAHAEDLYVANSGNGSIVEYNLAGQVDNIYMNVGQPRQIAFDAAGNLYVTNNDNPGASEFYNTVTKITPGGTRSTFITGLDAPEGLAFDTSGDLYVANDGHPGDGSPDEDSITEYNPSGALINTITSPTFGKLDGLAFHDGSLYAADGSADVIDLIDPATKGVSQFAGGLDDPQGFAFDSLGNLFVANYGVPPKPGTGIDGTTYNNSVVKISPDGKTVTPIADGLNGPFGVAVDPSGALYYDQADHNDVLSGVGPIGDPTFHWPITKVTNGTSTTFATGVLYQGPIFYDNGLAFGPASLTAVPEPDSLALLGLGVPGLIVLARRRRRA